MARIYTYSFEDTAMSISHPSYGSFSAFGTGIGSIAVAFNNDVTTHTVAADLAVVVSKFAVKTATVTIEAIQSSELNRWLTGLANYLESAPPSEFARAKITIRNNSTGESWNGTGVSHQKKADNALQSTAQSRSWSLMVANMEAN